MPLKLAFPDAREWRYLIASLATLIEEANFIADSEGLRLRALDPSRIAMVDFFIPREAFEEYSIEGDEKIVIGVNFDDLNKIMKRGKANERVIWEVKEGRLKITLIGKAERSFSLPLIDIVEEELPTPKVTFTVSAKMLSDTFKDALADAALVSDYVTLEADESALTLRAKSDKGEVTTKFSMEAGSLLDYDPKEPAKASYNLEYLTDIMKHSVRISDILTLEFASKKPLSLTFEVASGGQLRYFLAPSLEA